MQKRRLDGLGEAILLKHNTYFHLFQVSFELSEYTADVDAIGTLRLLEAIRICELDKTVRFYQASTSELYGKVMEIPQKETTPFYPRSPYGLCLRVYKQSNFSSIFKYIH